jgi:DNA-binding transcriptional LysR family regulator
VIAQSVIEPMLAEFMARWPDVRLDIHVDNSLTDLVAESFDAGIRLGERVERDMVAVPISGPMRSVVVASPAYFKRYGRPENAERSSKPQLHKIPPAQQRRDLSLGIRTSQRCAKRKLV